MPSMVLSLIGVRLGLASPVPQVLMVLTPELLSERRAELDEGLSDPGGRMEADSGPPTTM